jgi:hypothetical protein
MDAPLNGRGESPENRTRQPARPRACGPYAVAIIGIAMLSLSSHHAVADQPTVADVNKLLSANQFEEAAQALRSIDDAINAGTRTDQIDLTFPLAIAARSLEQQQDLPAAADLF